VDLVEGHLVAHTLVMSRELSPVYSGLLVSLTFFTSSDIILGNLAIKFCIDPYKAAAELRMLRYLYK
jgi:hypothetical protein